MDATVSLEVPLALAHPASPPAYDLELYPSQVRSLMVAWQASRLESYLDNVRALSGTTRELARSR